GSHGTGFGPTHSTPPQPQSGTTTAGWTDSSLSDGFAIPISSSAEWLTSLRAAPDAGARDHLDSRTARRDGIDSTVRALAACSFAVPYPDRAQFAINCLFVSSLDGYFDFGISTDGFYAPAEDRVAPTD